MSNPHPNPKVDNLVPQNKRTKEEQRKIASMGGKASAKARRARKTLREELILLLSEGDVQNKISLALIDEALNGNKSGSVTKAFEVIRDSIGEKPVDKVMLAEVEQHVIDEVERAVLDDPSTGD